MSKSFFIDTTLCTACRGCQVACKQWHDLPAEATENRGSYQNPPDSVLPDLQAGPHEGGGHRRQAQLAVFPGPVQALHRASLPRHRRRSHGHLQGRGHRRGPLHGQHPEFTTRRKSGSPVPTTFPGPMKTGTSPSATCASTACKTAFSPPAWPPAPPAR